MKHFLALLLAAFLTISSACAENITLHTASCFAQADAAAAAYTRLLAQWEDLTGNHVVDASHASDESWKTGVLMDFAAGNEPDVLFFFACTSDSAYLLNRVVPIAEIDAAYPELNIPQDPLCAESDGNIYAVPVRSFWEGLLCNTDLFERCGLPLPTTWDQLEQAVAVFSKQGIVPISISLSDVPHYLAEFAILACATPEEYQARPHSMAQVPQSWIDGMALIRRLYELGAFPADVCATNENLTSQLFRDKKAAMQLDGSWFANSLSQEAMDSTVVLPMPRYRHEQAWGTIGGVSMGFYLTRRAWNNKNRRSPAASLLAYLSTGENARELGGYTYTGCLLQSAETLSSLPLYGPIQDQMSQNARSLWFKLIPDVATGSITAQELWMQVMALNPFGDS